MTTVLHNFARSRRQAPRGLTLIEIMVVVGILVLLATILLAVTSAVSRKAEVSRTQVVLKGLEGIAKEYEAETGQPLLLNGADAVGTVYPFAGATPAFPSPVANLSFVNLLYRLPSTRDQLEKLLQNSGGVSERLWTAPAGPAGGVLNAGVMYIVDAWNNPIQYIRSGLQPGQNAQGFATTWPAAPRSYFRSAGPDGQMDVNNPTAAVNADDILSYEP